MNFYFGAAADIQRFGFVGHAAPGAGGRFCDDRRAGALRRGRLDGGRTQRLGPAARARRRLAPPEGLLLPGRRRTRSALESDPQPVPRTGKWPYFIHSIFRRTPVFDWTRRFLNFPLCCLIGRRPTNRRPSQFYQTAAPECGFNETTSRSR